MGEWSNEEAGTTHNHPQHLCIGDIIQLDGCDKLASRNAKSSINDPVLLFVFDRPGNFQDVSA